MEFKADIPIYIQIATQIKEQIMNGTLKDGDKLPSVREYSVVYEVSALTIQRAIEQLGVEGIILSKKGVGSFIVSGSREGLEKQMIGEQVKEFIERMRNMGLGDEKIVGIIKEELNNG